MLLPWRACSGRRGHPLGLVPRGMNASGGLSGRGHALRHRLHAMCLNFLYCLELQFRLWLVEMTHERVSEKGRDMPRRMQNLGVEKFVQGGCGRFATSPGQHLAEVPVCPSNSSQACVLAYYYCPRLAQIVSMNR